MTELVCSSMIDWLIMIEMLILLSITSLSIVTPSEHLLSLHPSVFWISNVSQMEQISSSVESIVIQGRVGEEEEESLTFQSPFSSYSWNRLSLILWVSINSVWGYEWLNDEWDLNRLQSITLRYGTLEGDHNTIESNELIMRSMNDNDDWLIRSSFSISNQRRWSQFRVCRKSDIG